MTVEQLRQNAEIVDSLGSALRSGEHGLSTVPELIKRVIRDESWREFVTKRGEHVVHDRFADFIVTPPLAGIGGSVELVKNVCRDDQTAADMIDEALQNPHGGDHKSEAWQNNVDNIHVDRPDGTSKNRALRKLRKDRPDLHERVLAEELSPHAAMVEAGFRRRTITVPTDAPESAARTLRRHMSPEDIERLKELL